MSDLTAYTVSIPLPLRLMDVCGHQSAKETCLLCEAASTMNLLSALQTPEWIVRKSLRYSITLTL